MCFGFRWETGDQIGTKDDVWPQTACFVCELDGIVAQMTALHALQDHVVARLHRQVQMRHQPRLVGQSAHQIGVGFGLIDRRQAQARQLRDVLQDLSDEFAERRRAGEIGAVAGDVDAGQNDFAGAGFDEAADLVDDFACRDGSRRTAAVRDDAERAAVIAAVLDLHIGARARAEAVDQVATRFLARTGCR